MENKNHLLFWGFRLIQNNSLTGVINYPSLQIIFHFIKIDLKLQLESITAKNTLLMAFEMIVYLKSSDMLL